MKKIISIFIYFATIFSTKGISQEGWYISPGFQIGIDSNGNTHRSAQITFGLLIKEYSFATGLTLGSKWIRIPDKSGKNIKQRYNYYDLQSYPLESIILETPIQPGIGFGLMHGDNMSLTPRVKVWSGFTFFLQSYEFINMKNDAPKHYFGLFGVLPLPIGVSDWNFGETAGK